MPVRNATRRKFALQALNTLYGIGRITIIKFLGTLLLHPKADYISLKAKQLLVNMGLKLLSLNFRKRRVVFLNMLRKAMNSTYHGIRYLQQLPLKGRTKTNGMTPSRQHASGNFYPFRIRKAIKYSTNKKTRLSNTSKKLMKPQKKQNAKKK